MKTKIEDYRGFEIEFDTDSESFISVSSEYDRQAQKKSYAACKKDIDEYIKANVNFKPVWVETERSMYHEKDRVKLIGIRKDGRFLIDKNGKTEQLSSYNQNYYYIYNEANEPIHNQINELELQIEQIREKKKQLSKQLIKDDLGLKELAAKYTI